jgi:hypothetical protein
MGLDPRDSIFLGSKFPNKVRVQHFNNNAQTEKKPKSITLVVRRVCHAYKLALQPLRERVESKPDSLSFAWCRHLYGHDQR